MLGCATLHKTLQPTCWALSLPSWLRGSGGPSRGVAPVSLMTCVKLQVPHTLLTLPLPVQMAGLLALPSRQSARHAHVLEVQQPLLLEGHSTMGEAHGDESHAWLLRGAPFQCAACPFPEGLHARRHAAAWQ